MTRPCVERPTAPRSAMDFYGLYRGVRNATWQLLRRFRVAVLPVSSRDIAGHMNVPVLSYAEAAPLIRQLRLEAYSRQNAGFALHLKARWFIFADEEKADPALLNFTLAHELGHVFLGHRLSDNLLFSPEPRPKTEQVMRSVRFEREADMFAARTLSPACVLWALNLRTPDAIAGVCGLPPNVAAMRAQRMEEFFRRDLFLKSREELDLFLQFLPFVAASSPGGVLPDHCLRRLEERVEAHMVEEQAVQTAMASIFHA